MTRDAWLRAGQFRGAREMTKRLRLLDTELAYLARQRREWIVVNCMGRMAH